MSKIVDKNSGSSLEITKEEAASDGGRAALGMIHGLLRQSNIEMPAIITEHQKMTRIWLQKTMNALDLDPSTCEEIWNKLFGSPPNTIAEFVRREIIKANGLIEYAEKIGSTRAILWRAMHTGMIPFTMLEQLINQYQQSLRWKGDELMQRWQQEYADALMQRGLASNALAAWIMTICETRHPKTIKELLKVEPSKPGSAFVTNSMTRIMRQIRIIEHH